MNAIGTPGTEMKVMLRVASACRKAPIAKYPTTIAVTALRKTM